MSKTDIRKANDSSKVAAAQSAQAKPAKGDVPTWKASFSKRLPHRFGEPLSSSGGGDGGGEIQY